MKAIACGLGIGALGLLLLPHWGYAGFAAIIVWAVVGDLERQKRWKF